jgi:hypothetical protein
MSITDSMEIILEKFSIFENLADFGIWETDIHKKILYVSRVFSKFTKMNISELIGKSRFPLSTMMII